MHAQHSARTKKNQTQNRSAQEDRASKQAKDALEALFTPEMDPKAKKAWATLSDYSGAQWQAQALTFIDEYGYPSDAQLCVALVDLEDVQALQGLFAFVQTQWADYSPSNRETFEKKLSVAAMMAMDDDLMDAMEAFKRTLGS